MDIRPIRTPRDHLCGARKSTLLGCAEGSEKGDKLYVLVVLVESYEARRWLIEGDEGLDLIDVLDYVIDGGQTQPVRRPSGPRSRCVESRRAATSR